MKIPAQKKFSIDSFPGQKDWIGLLLGPLNSFLNITFLALTNGLTFADNFTGQETLVDFTYQGASDFPMYFALNMRFPPKAIQVGRAFENGSPIIALVAWELSSDNRIRVTQVSKVSSATLAALTAGARYQFLLRFTP